ncbi:WD40/YVTN/BNR-like repeat-containing protein [Flavobacterium sp. 3HN19-14]|uniref:WD40/YVTN/BNR-like repeat-containing protein n=1 Tax=Flavobacterium sp. 3HN19-14 TaxID=3448133 RepID=UPI003EDEE8A4
MKKIAALLLTFSLLMSCQKEKAAAEKSQSGFTSLKTDVLLKESISVRALLIDSNKVWYAANNGKYGYYDLKTQKNFFGNVSKDTLSLEFRSIAKTSKYIFIASIGNPGLVYRISKDGREIKLVYQENHEKVFYDSMQFWNDTEGIAMGDPTDDCLSVIITRDGGNTWKKLPCDQLPKVITNEAAFAASNTNIVIKGNNTWLVSGGMQSRVFFSADKGNTWKVYNTPIDQGAEMKGIFTADFYDTDNGFIAGGNFDDPNNNSGNKAITKDGGKTWQLIAEKSGFGFASCVQYVPNSDGKALVSVGASGLQYSSDSAKTWKQLLNDNSLYTIRFIDDSTAIAAGKYQIIRIRFMK